ncbi:MAG: UDP-glucose/GDP-mannose dehydrogenase family protein [Chloroflexota bacterium]|nr:UDP-glucose/GDP-mannose dehydrogenase family protein [Chloroflexota bacterium]
MAEVGNDVVCLDIDETRVRRLCGGEVPIFEPELPEIIRQNLASGHISFTTDAGRAVDHATVIFIAVGTPPNDDGSADLRAVEAVAASIGGRMTNEKIVLTKSTVPVGTTDRVRHLIQGQLDQRGLDLAFDVVSNPEFLKEGSAVSDFKRPDRIVLGSRNERSISVLRELYAPFNRNHDRLMVMDIRAAEFTKYAANAMLATRISFMNEMANLADRLGVNIEQVRLGIGADSRIGYSYIYPGCGYGGSCFPKDVRALDNTARGAGFDTQLLRAVDAVNRNQKLVLVNKIRDHFGADLDRFTFALWGLAFKPNTDDMREAPSRTLLEALWAAGARVRAFDPKANAEAYRLYGDHPGLDLCETKEDALTGADALVIVTDWREFRGPDFGELKRALRSPVIFDGRNLYDPARLARAGFTYYGIGLSSSASSTMAAAMGLSSD